MNTNDIAMTIVSMYREGYSLSCISGKVGISRHQVTRIVKEAGVKIRSRREANRLTLERRRRSGGMPGRPKPPPEDAPVCVMCGGRFSEDDQPVRDTGMCGDCVRSILAVSKRRKMAPPLVARLWKAGALTEAIVG